LGKKKLKKKLRENFTQQQKAGVKLLADKRHFDGSEPN